MEKRNGSKNTEAGNVNKENSRTEKANRKKRLRLCIVVAFLFLLFCTPSLYQWIKNSSIKTDVIRNGYIENSVNADGLIVRNEELLAPAGYDGIYLPEVSEGERVKAFGTVATISNSVTAQLFSELEATRKKIIQAESERMKEEKFFSEDFNKINNSIKLTVQEVIKAGNNNTMSGLTSLKADIDAMIEKKAEIAGTNSNDTYISSLKKEYDAIQRRIKSSTARISSDKAGIVSYFIDGYEEILKPSSIKDIIPDRFAEIMSADIVNRSADNSVKKGDVFAKIIKSYETSIVVLLDKDKAANYEEGDEISVVINDLAEEIPGIIEYKSPEMNGKHIVSTRIDRCAEKLSAMRKINIDMVSDYKQGLKVPLECLFNIDEENKTAEIFLLKANVVTKRQVVIAGRDEEYAIIKNPPNEVQKTVNLYDTYILNYEKVKEGQLIVNG